MHVKHFTLIALVFLVFSGCAKVSNPDTAGGLTLADAKQAVITAESFVNRSFSLYKRVLESPVLKAEDKSSLEKAYQYFQIAASAAAVAKSSLDLWETLNAKPENYDAVALSLEKALADAMIAYYGIYNLMNEVK